MTFSDCPVCGRRELRGARSLHTLATPRGDIFATTCRGCGAEVAAGSNRLLRTGTVRAASIDAVA